MMKKTLISTIILGVILIVLSACNNPMRPKTVSENDSLSLKKTIIQKSDAEKLRTDMRKLWEDHITWTRNVILCLVDNLPGTDQAVKRLLKNQDEIGDAIKAYYGDDAGKKLTNLLHEHITISADVVKASKNNDKKALDSANKKWHDNADQISIFLSQANPHWKLEDMKMMMYDHLKLTTAEAEARIKKDYDGDVKAYDHVHDQILKMADMLSDGIIEQFTDKFNK